MPKSNKEKIAEARSFGASLNPIIDKLIISKDKISFNVLIEPMGQVRQTQRSGSYSPPAIIYNSFKHAVSNKLKEATHKHKNKKFVPLKGFVKVSLKFYCSINRKYLMIDLDNMIKAACDTINTTGKVPDYSKYPDSIKEIKIWEDDRRIIQYFDTGKYLDLNNPRIEVIIEKV